jgi:CheY-like chemotaxis protein
MGMPDRRRFFVVDDDAETLNVIVAMLESEAHEVRSCRLSREAEALIIAWIPDCVLVDIMMPEVDGLELCRRLRALPLLSRTRIVILTGKDYDFDRRRARELGADAYLVKPVRFVSFLSDLKQIMQDDIAIHYYGVRGTLPVPGGRSLRYGGNTSCVTAAIQGEPLLIFDAGTGIKELSNSLLSQKVSRLSARILISHPHWDHINALPFFAPLYVQGNEFEICGARHGDLGMEALIGAQMGGVYFPVTMREFAARVHFRDLDEETLHWGRVEVRTMLLSHPGQCLGYRVICDGRSLCYITDNELYLPGHPNRNEPYRARLAEFISGCDVLITDCAYLDEQYPERVGWGHSSAGEVVAIAARGQVKNLHLVHHDPDQSDEDIDHKLAQAEAHRERLGAAFSILAPAEGTEFTLRPSPEV